MFVIKLCLIVMTLTYHQPRHRHCRRAGGRGPGQAGGGVGGGWCGDVLDVDTVWCGDGEVMDLPCCECSIVYHSITRADAHTELHRLVDSGATAPVARL